MAKTVKEIMNSELLSVRPGDSAERALAYILAFDVTAVPVLDDRGKPLGVASLRDLLSRKSETTVAECMTAPAATIREGESIDRAARQLSDQTLHRLVVVSEQGRATGVVSALDVLSALLGRPVRHPAPFPHYDKALDVFWTDDMLLELDNIEAVPNGPGVLVLVSGGQHRAEHVVWAEAVNNLPARLSELVARPHTEKQELIRLLEREPRLRFRASHIPSEQGRERVARSIINEVRGAWASRPLPQ